MTDEPLRIGSAARALGTTTRTLRYYEEYGLLLRPGRSAAGQRRYDTADLERARAILTLRELGLPLHTIRDALDAGALPDLASIVEAQARLVALLDGPAAEHRAQAG